jgi:NAD(P)-dependent dehydrogenase (short-subunit alcohol dehydrogenase family)
MLMFDLTGKTALVTGATGGIGGAIAQAFHRQGATVALSGTRQDALDALAGSLRERVHVLPCNLSDREAVDALVSQAETPMPISAACRTRNAALQSGLAGGEVLVTPGVAADRMAGGGHCLRMPGS